MFASGAEGKEISFELQGPPEARPSPAYSPGNGMRYNSKKKQQKQTKTLIKTVLRALTQVPDALLFPKSERLVVELEFFMPRPRTDVKIRRGITTLRFPILTVENLFVKKTVDVDNLAKFMLDVMTKLVYWDDAQVHVLKVIKTYDNEKACEGRIVVTVRDIKHESQLTM